MANTPDNRGYWLAAVDGSVYAFGNAHWYGSAAHHTRFPLVGMAATPTGHGYWLVASDGGIFAYGDARYYGSTGGIRLRKPIVGMARTPTGRGYWLVASDGGMFSFGDAHFYGSAVHRSAAPIVGMARELLRTRLLDHGRGRARVRFRRRARARVGALDAALADDGHRHNADRTRLLARRR